MTVSAATLRVS